MNIIVPRVHGGSLVVFLSTHVYFDILCTCSQANICLINLDVIITVETYNHPAATVLPLDRIATAKCPTT